MTPFFEIVPNTNLHSRIHRLRSFEGVDGSCYVKRDDELGFGISGTKVRKYSSFLPSFLKERPDEAAILGSAYSNHVLSLSQLLKENGVKPILFLLGDPSCKLQGNLLLTALVAETKNIHWVSRSKWKEVDQMAAEYAKERMRDNIKVVVVPKGANCAASLPGAISLAQDVVRNEEELGLEFDHILIDSGTGLTACALLLAFALMKKKTFLHILLVAGDKEEFMQTLSERKVDLEALCGQSVPSPVLFDLYLPSTASSFGAVNKAIFNTIAELARDEGFLTDPVFTAKLFHEGRKIIAEKDLKGNILFVHSGGGLGLTGFQEEIAKMIK